MLGQQLHSACSRTTSLSQFKFWFKLKQRTENELRRIENQLNLKTMEIETEQPRWRVLFEIHQICNECTPPIEFKLTMVADSQKKHTVLWILAP